VNADGQLESAKDQTGQSILDALGTPLSVVLAGKQIYVEKHIGALICEQVHKAGNVVLFFSKVLVFGLISSLFLFSILQKWQNEAAKIK
jgi:predicted cation transporter